MFKKYHTGNIAVDQNASAKTPTHLGQIFLLVYLRDFFSDLGSGRRKK